MPFECDRCGACCRAMHCQHLVGTNFCSIYATRPEICRVDTMIERYASYGKDCLYEQTKQACRLLRGMETV